uniref:MEN2 n=1 Tax=Arundo donax TaxID=35708 RepID=A0A0A9AVT0_ARUDO
MYIGQQEVTGHKNHIGICQPKIALSAAIVRSHTICRTCPPPTA